MASAPIISNFTVTNVSAGKVVIDGVVIPKGKSNTVKYLGVSGRKALANGFITVSPALGNTPFVMTSPLNVSALTSYVTGTPTVIPNPSNTANTQNAIANLAQEVIRIANELASLQGLVTQTLIKQ